MRRDRVSRSTAAAATAVLVLAVVGMAALSLAPAAGAADDAWSVQLVAGDKAVTLSIDDLKSMPSATGRASFKKTTGAIEGPFTYKGVYISDLLAAVGGMSPTQAIRVTARDGYAMTYTHAQVEGNVLTYDADGEVLRVGGVAMMLAYEADDGSPGKLPRIVLVGKGGAAEAPITDGHYWTKQVARIEAVAGVQDWEITLDGLEHVVLDRSTFESAASCPKTPHPAVMWETTDKEGNKVVYEGVPLWVMISMVDGGDEEDGHYRFNDDLARSGYTVRVVSRDGFSAELESALVARNSGVMLAFKKDASPLSEGDGPLMLAGKDLPSRKYMVKQIAKIELVGISGAR